MIVIPDPVTIHPEKIRAGLRAPVFIPWLRWSIVYDNGAPGQSDADGKADLRLRGERCA
jgi:hypothetical protein